METIDDFLASRNYAKPTKRKYREILTRFLAELDPANISAFQLVTWIENKTEWGNSQQCVALSCIKTYLGNSHPAGIAHIKRTRGKVPRTMDSTTALNLLASFNRHTTKGARDLAMASLMLDTGLRVSEVCRLQQADTDTEHRILQVLVKGGSWEWAVFSEETAAHIEHWKRFRSRLNPRGELFVSTKTGNALTPSGTYNIVEAWGQNIGIKLGPHDFRRTFATIASENGAPDRVIMEGGRWKSVQMVTRYTRSLRLESMRHWLPVKRLTETK